MPAGPLTGLVVADCSTVLAGPYCTMLLGDLGAEVVKVEPLDGDPTRGWGPPWVGAGRAAPDDPGIAAYFLAVNRNKRSLRLDLKVEPGREALRRLLRRADVLVENFRPGGFAGLGFDDATLEALNPRLVHLAISGYGPDGPAADRPGYDFVIQAVAGLMSITGFPDAEGGHPTKVGVAVSDLTTGMLGAVAVLGALLGRDRPVARHEGVGRDRSVARDKGLGGGQRIDISLYESTFAWLANQAQNLFATGSAPERRGNAHPSIVPYETFATADGQIAVAVGTERQWHRFCVALEHPGLERDPRFARNADRVEHREELRGILGERLRVDSSAVWMGRLEAADVPCGPIRDLAEAFDDPQAVARGMVVPIDHPILGTMRQVRPPFTLARTPARVRSAPPMLGEHSAEVLSELGYDGADIDRLRSSGVI